MAHGTAWGSLRNAFHDCHTIVKQYSSIYIYTHIWHIHNIVYVLWSYIGTTHLFVARRKWNVHSLPALLQTLSAAQERKGSFFKHRRTRYYQSIRSFSADGCKLRLLHSSDTWLCSQAPLDRFLLPSYVCVWFVVKSMISDTQSADSQLQWPWSKVQSNWIALDSVIVMLKPLGAGSSVQDSKALKKCSRLDLVCSIKGCVQD